MTVRFGVIGIDHLHLFELVQGLLEAGAVPVAHAPEGDLVGLYEGWQKESASRPREGIIGADDIDLVVTAAVPKDRARIAIAALSAGHDVLTDKPGVTTMEDLLAVEA